MFDETSLIIEYLLEHCFYPFIYENSEVLAIHGFYIEKHLNFGRILDVNLEYAFGTCDFFCVRSNEYNKAAPDSKYVIDLYDFKFGNIKIESFFNPQLMLYALGILDDRPYLRKKENNVIFRLHILQIEDGKVVDRVWETSNVELLSWAEEIKPKVKHIVDLHEGKVRLEESDFNEDCKYCSAEGVLNKKLVSITDKFLSTNKLLSAEDLEIALSTEDLTRISEALRVMPYVEKYFKEVKQQAEYVVKNGGTIPDFDYVKLRQSPLKWVSDDIDDIKGVFNRLGVDVSLTKTVLKTPTAIKKEIEEKYNKEMALKVMESTCERGEDVMTFKFKD